MARSLLAKLMLAALLPGGLLPGAAAGQVVDLEQRWLESSADAADPGIERAAGRFGKAWDIAAAGKPVLIENVAFPHAFSLETWFCLQDTAGRSTLFSSTSARRFVITIADGSFVEISLFDRGAEPQLRHHSFGYDFAPGRWYQMAITADEAGGIRFYINGQLAHRLPAFTNERRKSDLGLRAIGAYSISGKGAFDHAFRGLIDRTIFTGRAWQAQEVAQRYADAIATVPVVPVPVQTAFVGDPLPAGSAAPRVQLNSGLIAPDDRGLLRLQEAASASRLGGVIVLSDTRRDDLPEHVRQQLEGDLPAEGYVLSTRPQRIDIVAGDARGLIYGIDTARQLLALPAVPQVDIYDYPELPYRAGLMVTNNQPPASLQDGFGGISLKQTIEDFADHRMNAIMLRIYNWAWLDEPQNLAQAKEIVDYARKHHVQVIPYLQCYGHAKMFTWRDMRADHTRTIADEAVELAGEQPVALKTPNVIITANTPVLVHLADGTAMAEGRDFEVVAGELKMSWVPPKDVKVPYATWGRPWVDPLARPFAIRRLPGSRIDEGATVKVTYDVAANSREYCPFSPVTHELVNDTIRRVIELTDADCISLGMDEMWTPIGREGRCCAAAAGLTPAEVTKREMNRTLAVAQSIKPGIRVMYWSDMLDPSQTPHWMSTWEAADEAVEGIDRRAVMMPWYYNGNSSSWWRIGRSMERFAGRGFPVIGASGHDPVNQFFWAAAVRGQADRRQVPGFTYTTWASGSKHDVLVRGYRAFSQATWSPSRTPFEKLLRLRLELSALGVAPDLDEAEWAAAAGAVSPLQRQRLGALLMTAEMELNSVDVKLLEDLKIPGVDEILTAVSQAHRLLGTR